MELPIDPRGVRVKIISIVGVLALVFLALAVLVVLGWRAKSPRVLNTVRRVNRKVFNPRMIRSAGTPGAHVAVIRHTGRTSGKAYQTPVGAVMTEDGFVVALPYGPNTDWLKNVVENRSASIVHEGRTYPVDRPEVVQMQLAAARFPWNDRWGFRVLRIDHCLRVRSLAAVGEREWTSKAATAASANADRASV
jgi:deazaflavin-dependent oxidoreductase (nitroreductase family)